MHRIVHVCAMQSRTDLRGLRSFLYKVVSTQMEVDCDTHLMPIQHKLKSIWYKLKSFRSKSELEEILVKVFSRSHRNMIAIDRKNVIPEGEKSCLSEGLGTFSASWIWWTPSLKPAQFEWKSDEPHSGTNRPVSLVNSKRGNSIVIISDCQVS